MPDLQIDAAMGLARAHTAGENSPIHGTRGVCGFPLISPGPGLGGIGCSLLHCLRGGLRRLPPDVPNSPTPQCRYRSQRHGWGAPASWMSP